MSASDSNDATPHKRCLDCGYILAGLPENRCPECGRGFDPHDSGTYLTRVRDGRPYFVAALIAAGVIAAPYTRFVFIDTPMIPFLVLISGAAQVFILARSATVLLGPRAAACYRYAFVGAISVSALSLVGCCGIAYAMLTFRWQE